MKATSFQICFCALHIATNIRVHIIEKTPLTCVFFQSKKDKCLIACRAELGPIRRQWRRLSCLLEWLRGCAGGREQESGAIIRFYLLRNAIKAKGGARLREGCRSLGGSSSHA